jgi:phosphoglucosamine mutase
LPGIKEAIAEAEAHLVGQGRVLLRPSGTEPVVRVMVEGADHAVIDPLCQQLASKVEAALRQA